MTPEMESQIFSDLGAIKNGIVNLNHLLETHTAQDMTQFSAMTDTVKDIGNKVDKIITDLAVDDALKKQHEQFVKKIAGWRAAWVSLAITVLSTIAQIFIPMMFK